MEKTLALAQYIIFEAIFFMVAFSCTVGLVNAANKQVAYTNREVQDKSTIVSNVSKEEIESLKVSGTNVYSDIINMDESLEVYINNTLLNTELTVNGKNFLEYVRKTDNKALSPYILFEHEYYKTVLINEDGEMIGVRFSL